MLLSAVPATHTSDDDVPATLLLLVTPGAGAGNDCTVQPVAVAAAGAACAPETDAPSSTAVQAAPLTARAILRARPRPWVAALVAVGY